jgi:molybdate transport system regulatory protein
VADYPYLRLRVILTADTFIGPGKADLLQGVQDAGSIAAAGRRMGMSYKRAWGLMETMNAYFGEPLAIATKGGKSGGGAQLTPKGRQVLACYRRIEARAARAAARDLVILGALRAPESIDAA